MTKRIVWMSAVLLLGAATAFAQQQAVGDGFQAPSFEPSIDWWTILYFVVAAAGTFVVGFKSPGRTHLD
jgi:hypothetical protein